LWSGRGEGINIAIFWQQGSGRRDDSRCETI